VNGSHEKRARLGGDVDGVANMPARAVLLRADRMIE
jgi:hypothetical protein